MSSGPSSPSRRPPLSPQGTPADFSKPLIGTPRRDEASVGATREASKRLGLEPSRMADTEVFAKPSLYQEPTVRYIPVAVSRENTVYVREMPELDVAEASSSSDLLQASTSGAIIGTPPQASATRREASTPPRTADASFAGVAAATTRGNDSLSRPLPALGRAGDVDRSLSAASSDPRREASAASVGVPAGSRSSSVPTSGVHERSTALGTPTNVRASPNRDGASREETAADEAPAASEWQSSAPRLVSSVTMGSGDDAPPAGHVQSNGAGPSLSRRLSAARIPKPPTPERTVGGQPPEGAPPRYRSPVRPQSSPVRPQSSPSSSAQPLASPNPQRPPQRLRSPDRSARSAGRSTSGSKAALRADQRAFLTEASSAETLRTSEELFCAGAADGVPSMFRLLQKWQDAFAAASDAPLPDHENTPAAIAAQAVVASVTLDSAADGGALTGPPLLERLMAERLHMELLARRLQEVERERAAARPWREPTNWVAESGSDDNDDNGGALCWTCFDGDSDTDFRHYCHGQDRRGAEYVECSARFEPSGFRSLPAPDPAARWRRRAVIVGFPDEAPLTLLVDALEGLMGVPVLNLYRTGPLDPAGRLVVFTTGGVDAGDDRLRQNARGNIAGLLADGHLHVPMPACLGAGAVSDGPHAVACTVLPCTAMSAHTLALRTYTSSAAHAISQLAQTVWPPADVDLDYVPPQGQFLTHLCEAAAGAHARSSSRPSWGSIAAANGLPASTFEDFASVDEAAEWCDGPAFFLAMHRALTTFITRHSAGPLPPMVAKEIEQDLRDAGRCTNRLRSVTAAFFAACEGASPPANSAQADALAAIICAALPLPNEDESVPPLSSHHHAQETLFRCHGTVSTLHRILETTATTLAIPV